jgi:hypothetical protein
MTISSADNKVQISSGSTITITNLEAQSASQVLVTKKNASDVESTLVLTTDYTIDSGLTTVTLNVALATNETATASLNIPNTQATDYKNASPFNAETAEDAFDKLTLKNKQQQEELDRSVKFVISETASDNIEIPDVTGNGDKFLKLNSGATAFEWGSDTSVIGGLSKADGTFYVGDGTTVVAETGATARASLGLTIGTDVQAYDADLDTLSTAFTTASASTAASLDLAEDTDNGSNKVTIKAPAAVTSDRVATLPDATTTLVGTDTTDTLTNKTINTANNTITVVEADISDLGSYITASSADTLTNKTFDANGTGNSISNIDLTADVINDLPITEGGTGASDAATALSNLGGIGAATSDTLTNKTFDANGTGNSLSNVDVADLANGTDGELITWDAAGAPATVAVGTSGHVLTSNGLGAAPTFQSPSVASGSTVQVVNVLDTAVATGTTTIPEDDTIPQNTEGDEYMTLAITPTSSSNKLLIEVVVFVSHSAANAPKHAALFQDSTANALATGSHFEDTAGGATPVVFSYYMTAGTTSSTTFKVSAGSNLAGTTTFNGLTGSRLFGGTYTSSITITEIEV